MAATNLAQCLKSTNLEGRGLSKLGGGHGGGDIYFPTNRSGRGLSYRAGDGMAATN